jgi:hypothetical protein
VFSAASAERASQPSALAGSGSRQARPRSAHPAEPSQNTGRHHRLLADSSKDIHPRQVPNWETGSRKKNHR